MTDDLRLLTPDLDSLGWNEELEEWATNSPQGALRGRIAQSTRGFSLVFTGGDAIMAASSSVRSNTGFAPSTGDFVTIVDDPEDGPTVHDIAPRRTALTRRAPGRVPEAQILASNIDDVFVMQGLDRPLNLRRIERQLVIVWESGAKPVILLTKSDTIEDEASAIELVQQAAPDVEIIATSTVTGSNIDRVRSHFVGTRTIALLGLSGIGKSTLVNAMSDGIVQRTGEVRAADRRGRHTTVTRDLIPLPGGGLVIDTPGIREVGLWQAHTGLERTFPEVAKAAAECRFTDCDHRAEPGCGVRSAQELGLVEERRLEHWRDLLGEIQLQDTQLEDFARRAESRSRADVQSRRNGERRKKPKGSKRRGKH